MRIQPEPPSPVRPVGHAVASLDRTKLRVVVLALLVAAAFFGLYSRLWYLQILAADDYDALAKENRVRLVQSEPQRGRILDRTGEVLVENRLSLALTVDRQVVDTSDKERRILRKIAGLTGREVEDLRVALHDRTVSAYKPVAVARDIPQRVATHYVENQEDFPGVDVVKLPIRSYPQGSIAAHVLGYVREISESQLASRHFRRAKPPYAPGDLVGQDGIEYAYDRFLRGRAQVDKVVVNSRNEVVRRSGLEPGRTGKDLITGIDRDVQNVSERALIDGIKAARAAGYQATTGAVVVMDPTNGDIRAMASFPSYPPAMLADGITQKEWASLGGATPNLNTDDRNVNRAIRGAFQPGSTFKVVTAGAAIASGLFDARDSLSCPPAYYFGRVWRNWSSADYGLISLPRSLEISCDTFYYELGARLERAFGARLGDGSERFQKYMRRAGFGRPTGIDLPNEHPGRVPDEQWCQEVHELYGWCSSGWLAGYNINMSIGQGDLLVTPLQMAATYAGIANDGVIMRPRIAKGIGRLRQPGSVRLDRRFRPRRLASLPLGRDALRLIERGLVDAVVRGTAASAFSGFPIDRFPLAGKTGTAQIGSLDSGLNYAWFLSYGPVYDPRYVVSVYLERAGHGGESAAPVARQIWEHIAGVESRARVTLGSDESG